MIEALNKIMSGQELPIGYWGLDSVFWSYVRLFISDIRGLSEYESLPETIFCLNGIHPIHRVCIVGVAVDVRVYATNTTLWIDDGTGIISSTLWHNDEEPTDHQNRLGQLLLVTGKLSKFRGDRQIQIKSFGMEVSVQTG